MHVVLGFVVWAFLVTPLADSYTSIYAQVEGKYGEKLSEAEQLYNTGSFDQAIEILSQVISETDILQEEKQRAYRLLGLNYIAKELEEEARNAVTKLLEMVPDYKTDPIQDPPPFIKLVEEVKVSELEQKKEEEEEGGVNWLWIAGGAAAAGAVVAVLIFSGGDDDGGSPTDGGVFPSPPVRPQ